MSGRSEAVVWGAVAQVLWLTDWGLEGLACRFGGVTVGGAGGFDGV